MKANRRIAVKPFDRLMGNAVLTHILADRCSGRMIMREFDEFDGTQALGARYAGLFECAICGNKVVSKTNKSQ